MNKKKYYRAKTTPQKAQGILSAALRKHGLDEKIARYNFVLHWAEIVGDELAQVCSPSGITAGVLFVKVPSSVWAQELSFQKSVLINRLNRFLIENQEGTEQIKDIRFAVEA